MKKRIKEIALYVLCTLFLIPMVALAESGYEGSETIYYVATNGSNSNPGTEAQPWLTIQKAADTMTAGDTVYVKEGVYNEQVVPQNSGTPGNYITYTAYPGDTVTIDGDGISLPSYFGGLFEVSDKSYIKISGLKLTNAGPNQYNAGIMIYNSSYIIVEKNHTYNTVSSGIGVLESSNIIIDDNEVELACNDGSQECITLSMTDTFEVRNNHVHHGGSGSTGTEGGGEGIDVKNGSSNGKIYNNFVHHINSVGIYVDAWDKHTYNIEVFKNIVSDCGDGIDVASEQGGLLEDIRIYNNIVYDNKLVGITIAGWGGDFWPVSEHPTRNIEIINNTIYNNGHDIWGGGIWVYNPDARNIIIRNNICSQNLSFQIVVDSDIPVQNLNLTVNYNLIDGYRGYDGEMYGSDYVEENPMFANLSQADFHLQENSPAIDSGSSFDAPDDDFDGNHRPQASDHDIGAYEYDNAISELAVDFGSYGIWLYDETRGWIQIATENPSKVVNYDGKLVAQFSYGLCKYDGTDWNWLSDWKAEDMIAIGADLYVDFGSYGIWLYDETQTWTQITNENPTRLANYNGKLVANIYSGLCEYVGPGWNWNWLFGHKAEDMIAIGADLYVDFGSYGIWLYDETRGWIQIATENPSKVVNYDGKLVAQFSYGLCKYDGTDWNWLSDWKAEDMIAIGADLYVDVGSYGIWLYDETQTWTQITNENPTRLANYNGKLVANIYSGLCEYVGPGWNWNWLFGHKAEDIIGF